MMSLLFFILFTISSAELELQFNSTAFGEEYLEYTDPDGTVLEGYLVVPRKASSQNKLPAVILFHAFTGRGDFDDEKAMEIARLGYVAFAADTYGKDWMFTGLNESFGMMGQMLENRSTTLKGRILAAWKTISQMDFVDKARIASIGFCYGGLCSLDLARYDLGAKAVVAFHADLTNLEDNLNRTTRTAIQVHHGDSDTLVPSQQVDEFLEEMRVRRADWEFAHHGGAQHAFTLPGVDEFNITGAAYSPTATRRAWAAMTDFLREKLE